MSNIIIRQANWPEDKDTLRAIRKTVFVIEQGVPEEQEWDEFEESSTHFLASENEFACACVRVLQSAPHEFKITRLAVLEEKRKQGLASALLQHAVCYALNQGAKRIYMHAQSSAISLYKKWAFRSVGQRFEEAGIEHQLMEFDCQCSLSIALISGALVQRLNYPRQYIRHFQTMAEQSRLSLHIISDTLRSDIFSDTKLVDAISALARRDRHSEIKILVKDKKNLHERAGQLIRLCRRLNSKISIQVLNDKQDEPLQSFCIFDREKLLFFNDEASLAGFACYQSKAECKDLLEKFQHAWDHQSSIDPNMAQLYL
ncbi:GNAT family N-acetyltransferase [Agaribacterium haliotis]|uniref:GNAT family N-acetyltransferase n=1 Tax=Agaribacterium haliotis TaxID=2013869 RepID=UPI00130436EE|nr:GNAT family N-acetyltransferase [Agaribacterium haliotis]